METCSMEAEVSEDKGSENESVETNSLKSDSNVQESAFAQCDFESDHARFLDTDEKLCSNNSLAERLPCDCTNVCDCPTASISVKSSSGDIEVSVPLHDELTDNFDEDVDVAEVSYSAADVLLSFNGEDISVSIGRRHEVPRVGAGNGASDDNERHISLAIDSGELPDEISSTTSSSSIDTDDSVDFGGYTINRVQSDDSDGVEHGAAATSSERIRDVDDQEEGMSISRRMERARRKRLHSFLRQSSSSDSAETESDDISEPDSESGSKTSRLDIGEDPSVKLLPVDSWKPVSELFRRQIGGIHRLHRSFTGCVGGSTQLVRRLMLYDKFEVHDGCVNALHFNESGSLIASGSDDLKVVVFDWVKKQTFITFQTGHRSNVFQAKFLPLSGDCHLVTCARDGQIRLAQLSATGTCNRTKKLASHKQAAHKLALLNDSPHVFYSCGEDSVVFQIDLRQEQPNKCYVTKENDRQIPLYSIHANPCNSNEHCVGGRDQYIRIYDVRMIHMNDDKKTLVKKFCPHHLLTSDYKAHITCAVYNYNGTEIIGSYNDDDIYLFDATHSDGAQHNQKYCGHRNNATVKGVNFYGPKSEFVVSGSDCGNVFIWHRESAKIVNYFHADEGGVVNVLEPHPHLPLLATSGLDNDFKLWMPTASEPSSLANLQTVTKKNQKEREEDRNEPDVIDSQMLWFLMHTLRRNAARRAASAAGGSLFFGMSDSDPSDESNDDDDDDNDGGGAGHSQCTTS